MAMNPLAVSRAPAPPGMQPQGANTRPYPALGPAQGGLGPGAAAEEPAPGGDGSKDNIASIARLLTMAGIDPFSNDPMNVERKKAFFSAFGIQSAKRLGAPDMARGITNDPMDTPPEREMIAQNIMAQQAAIPGPMPQPQPGPIGPHPMPVGPRPPLMPPRVM